MCVAMPAKVLEITEPVERIGRVDASGTHRLVNLSMLDDVAPGDWVLIQTGFAVEKIDEAQAQELIRSFEQLGAAIEQDLAGVGEERGA